MANKEYPRQVRSASQRAVPTSHVAIGKARQVTAASDSQMVVEIECPHYRRLQGYEQEGRPFPLFVKLKRQSIGIREECHLLAREGIQAYRLAGDTEVFELFYGLLDVRGFEREVPESAGLWI